MDRKRSVTDTEAVTVSTVFANLMNKAEIAFSHDDQLVIDAIRRANHSLTDASLSRIGDHLWTMDAAQIRGFASDVKGIYHEMRFVDGFNASHEGVTARMFEQVNYPGADVAFSKGGVDVGELQLKAGQSTQLIQEHLQRYPDIPVAASDEIAQKAGVASSGFTNADLSSEVSSSLHDIAGQGHVQQLVHASEASALVAGALHAVNVLRGKAAPSVAAKAALRDMGVAVTATYLFDLLF